MIFYEGDFLFVGIIDEDFKGNLFDVVILNEEIDYLIDVVNNYFKFKIICEDIVYIYSGVCLFLEEKNVLV